MGKFKKALFVSLVGLLLSSCGEENINKRDDVIAPPVEDPNPGLTKNTDNSEYVKNHPDSVIECLQDEHAASSCRLIEAASTLKSNASNAPESYEVEYNFACGQGVFDSGLVLTASENLETGEVRSLKTDTTDTVSISGPKDLRIEVRDSAAFAEEMFEKGCYLTIQVL